MNQTTIQPQNEINVQTFAQDFNISTVLACAFFAQCQRLGKDIRSLIDSGKTEKAIETLCSSQNLLQMNLTTFFKLLRKNVLTDFGGSLPQEICALVGLTPSTDGIPLHLCIVPSSTKGKESKVSGTENTTYIQRLVHTVSTDTTKDVIFIGINMNSSTFSMVEGRFRHFLRFLMQLDGSAIKLKNVETKLAMVLGWDEKNSDLMCRHRFTSAEIADLTPREYKKLVSYFLGDSKSGGTVDFDTKHNGKGNPNEFVQMFIINDEKPNLKTLANELLSEKAERKVKVNNDIRLQFKTGEYVTYNEITYQITSITSITDEGKYILMDDDFDVIEVSIREGNNNFQSIEI